MRLVKRFFCLLQTSPSHVACRTGAAGFRPSSRAHDAGILSLAGRTPVALRHAKQGPDQQHHVKYKTLTVRVLPVFGKKKKTLARP